MHQLKLLLIFICLPALMQCSATKTTGGYKTETLEIKKLTENTFIHISLLKIPNYGTFPCNGLVFKNGNEVVVFDTPVNDRVSQELINWVEKDLKCKVKAIVINHSHDDCLGGLQAFHDAGVESYASNMTIELAKADSVAAPKNGFDNRQELLIGDQKIINEYFGEGHSADNISSYLPSENVLFGGCMIKTMNARKGNLNDANVEEWSNTVAKIKAKYLNIKFVIPGHGPHGGSELFDYTIELFNNR